MQPRQPAYSLIFAFMVMTVMMIIATTTVQNTREKVVYFRDIDANSQALLAAQSSAEEGLLAMEGYSAGYSTVTTDSAFCADPNGDGDCEGYGTYTIYSSGAQNDASSDDYWYTPIPGTGTAGNSEDCSILNEHEDVDHPCNWNRLLYGESVTIPLYTDDGSGAVLTAGDLSSFTGWNLKMRTPCEDPDSTDVDCVRYTFDGDGDLDTDSSIVLWQLLGTDTAGNDVLLVPEDAVEPDAFDETILIRESGDNTEIYESLVNEAYLDGASYYALRATDSNPYRDIYSLCTESTTELETLSPQLDIVSPLMDEDGDSIPYLEWQFELDASEPFGSTELVILGEGYYQGQSGIFYYPYTISRSTTGETSTVYSLSN